MNQASGIPCSGFFDRLQGINNLQVSEWLFHAGMLFESEEKWWGGGGQRPAPHEGIDICFYRTPAGSVQDLCPGLKIPVLYKGKVVRIVSDFLGMTVFISHSQFGADRKDFNTIYGHVSPLPGLSEGMHVGEGDVIAALADCRGAKGGLPPHLHLSAAWVDKEVETELLGWDLMKDLRNVQLVDPMLLTCCSYSLFPA